MEELVSVIVTCYNHEKYIAQCLDSIFSQSYKNLELLIINDGSTDGSGEMIEQLLPNSPFANTEYVSQENVGICFTRNKGLAWARGDFVLFVDSDNYLDDDYIEQMVATANHHKADIVYADLYDAEAQQVFMEARDFDLTAYLSANFIDNCSLLRREKIKDARYDEELNRKKLVDYDFIMGLILLNNAQPVKCNETKLNYRVLDNSISRQENHASEVFYFEVYLYILNKYIDRFPAKIMKAIVTNVLTLASRLDELIEHLQGVTNHVHNQEEDIKRLSAQVERLQAEIQERIQAFEQVEADNKSLLNDNKNLLNDNQKLLQDNELLLADNQNLLNDNQNLLNDNQNLLNDNQRLTGHLNKLEVENQTILNSRSYRIGNKIIKPFYYGAKVLKNPALFVKALRKAKQISVRRIKKIPSVKTVYLKRLRELQRNQNNYDNPRRLLIFVIYSNGQKLPGYKVYFLKELSKIVEKTLIVVNGMLIEEDLHLLEQIGHVEIRPNVGYDTAAFRYGIQYLGQKNISEYDELLLVNDTNVGPVSDLTAVFTKMAKQKLDFWGISYGEEQNDFTNYNKYGYIPVHLQSYFLVIEKSLLKNSEFYEYWKALDDTDSRNKAIGKHETVFTKHFEELGYKHGAVATNNEDSPMYIHPLQMVKEGVPLIKYTAFSNYNNDKFAWQGLLRETEVPALIDYLREETNFPMEIIDEIMFEVKNKKVKEHILIIDGVENAIPQLTTYRVQNKKEQLVSLGYEVWTINLSAFQMGYAEHASHIIIYRAPLDHKLIELINLACKYHKPVLYDIDDLVIDTKYTDQLTYVQNLPETEKQNYNNGVISYGEMLKLCDGVVTSTGKMKEELQNYKDLVLLNRNLANQRLVELSQAAMENVKKDTEKIKIGYFSGSITHNENFELIKPALSQLLKKYKQVELHLVGHLDIPDDFKAFNKQIQTHPFVSWEKLPELVAEVDINLAPLVQSIFNEAKSEIKWLEAALVKVPTLASNLGSFREMIIDNETGVLVNDNEWYEKLEELVLNEKLRSDLANAAFDYVKKQCVTTKRTDELVGYIDGKTS